MGGFIVISYVSPDFESLADGNFDGSDGYFTKRFIVSFSAKNEVPDMEDSEEFCPRLPQEVMYLIIDFWGIEKQTLYEHEFQDKAYLCPEPVLSLIVRAAPAVLHYQPWKRVYNMAEDGTSFKTFYKQCQQHAESILVCKDKMNTVFGCYATAAWKPQKDYVGNSRGFIFSISHHHGIHIWHARGTEMCFQRSTHEYICCGGEKAALYISDNFERGSSNADCKTYKNEVSLCPTSEFEIQNVEVWVPIFD